jgi:signal transduction histidine kinase
MSAAVATRPRSRRPHGDPVLLVPLGVLAGLTVGWFGGSAGVGGGRVALDLIVAWGLIAASLVTLGRARWRRSRTLLATAAFALLAADLTWATSDALWTIGLLAENLWLALLVHFAVTFPGGRAWSISGRVAIVGAYLVTAGGQLVGAALGGGKRNRVGIASNPDLAGGIDRAQGVLGAAIAILVAIVVLRRLRDLGPPVRLVQGPVLFAAAMWALTTAASVAAVAAGKLGSNSMHLVLTAGGLLVPAGVIAGMLWSRLRRPEASELVVELRTGGATNLRDRLARALNDESLELAYRIDGNRYVDAAGRAMDVTGRADRAVTLIRAGGEDVAALVHDASLLDDPALVESVRATAALVIENERLAAEVLSQLAEVRASRTRIVAVADGERRRIERNLHDGLQQRLVTLCLELGLAATREDADAPAALARAHDQVEQAIAELRELARGIHPTLLREEGLEAAVEAVAGRASLPVTVRVSVHDRLPDAVELAAYLLVSEALTNVAKHASASHAAVRLERTARTLLVVVADDGVGGAQATSGSGLTGLRDRLAALDATFVVESDAGAGTTISTEIPCAS